MRAKKSPLTPQFPHAALEITERGSADLEELVRNGEMDLALAALESVSSHLTCELIEREVAGILAGARSQLALRYPSGTAITLDMAAENTFISLKEGHSIRVVQDVLFRRYDLEPKVLLETDSLEVARRVLWALEAVCCAPTFMWTTWFAARSFLSPGDIVCGSPYTAES